MVLSLSICSGVLLMIVASGVVGLGKYGKCILQFGFEFGL